ncbi:MerR family transcriptional regulator (plasmid) [Phyllobacterium zundukense]|jgi:DNA-binding transcriptional MerR regulator|uniref:MerR family transcriptional regulator n=1 Tax=Phyllobacterium zundukense TaxID=1867719 RepID=UPI000C49DBF6|nr:helix-turn-helix domain-containing protein [Phyllobacterium zundukense]ATU95848.1 MerR family transcriptional regulator [Phyllobacterium zundukense]
MERTFSIGRLSTTTGCKVETIRYYESIGLLDEPERSDGNQRRYLKSHHERLLFILHARDLGMSIEAIRQLIALSRDPDAPCDGADEIARQQLGSVRDKIQRLKLLEAELQRVVESCDGHRIGDCRVIEALAECGACHRDHRAPR